MYDKYEKLYSVNEIADFTESFSTVSIYKNGELLYDSKFRIVVKYSNQKFNLIFNDVKLESYITNEFLFDAVSNIEDRLILYSIDESKSNNSVVETYRAFFGSTRRNYTFSNNEPWLCNIFKINSKIVRIVFILFHSETMIEFEK